jgi:hypothetical protein
MAGELPDIEQEFIADVTRWLAGIEAMIQAGREFIENCAEETAAVEALQLEIDRLDGKIIEIQTIYTSEGLGDNLDDIERLDYLFRDVSADGRMLSAALDDLRSGDAALSETMVSGNSVLDQKVGKLSELENAARSLGLSDEDLARLADESGAALFRQGEQAKSKEEQLLDLVVATGEAAIAEQALAEAADESGAAAGRGRIQIGWWNISLTTLHWIVSGTIEVLAVLIPALVAVGAAADVGLQGVTETADRMRSLYSVTESLGGAFNITGGMVYGLKGNLQAAQNAADPQIWELLGEGIKAVGDSSGWFITMGEQVIQILDAFGARIDTDVDSNMKQMQSVLGDGAKDLKEFGEVFGNLGMAIFSAASQMPGLAEVLLGLLADITRVISVVVQFSGEFRFMGVSVLTVTMALEEFMRWGGLVVSMMAGLGIETTALGDRFLSMERFQGVFMSLALAIPNAAVAISGGLSNMAGGLANVFYRSAAVVGVVPLLGDGLDLAGDAAVGASVGIAGFGEAIAGAVAGLTFFEVAVGVVAAVGVGILIDKILTATSATQKFIAQLEDAADTATFSQGMIDDANNMEIFSNNAAQATKVVQQLGAVQNTPLAFHGELNETAVAAHNATMAMEQYNQASKQTAEQEGNAISAITALSQQYGVTMPEALALANTAGLKLGTSLTNNGRLTATAATEVGALVQGYQVMSGSALGLGNNVAAVNAQLGLQGSQLSKVNGAWDQFLANAIGGTEAYATLNDDISTMGNVTTDATSKIESFSQQSQGLSLSVGQISAALKSFGPESSQVWQNYDSALTQAGTVTDWWRTAAASGAVTGAQMNNAIADTAKQLLPFTANSTTAAAQLGVLVQEAGGPALTNYKQLKTWIDANSTSQANYNSLLGATTTAMSNVSQAAAQFSQTMDAMVVTAVEEGSVNLGQITTDAKNFNNALKENPPDSIAVYNALQGLVSQFAAVNIGGANAVTIVKQMGTNSHLSAPQVASLANETLNLYDNMSKIHNVNASINISEMITTTQTGTATGPIAPGLGKYVPQVATGGRISGYGGGDIVPAMLEPGEAVVPKHLVGAVAPFLGAHGVPGFAKGGVVETPMEKVIAEWASEIWKQDLKEYGKKGPISSAEMTALLGPSKFPTTGIWANPQYRDLRTDERAAMDPYYIKNLAYEKIGTEITSLKTGEASQIADWESQIAYNKTHPADAAYWDAIYSKDISSLRKEDATKLRDLQADQEKALRALGYSRGGLIPFGHYDEGGYLPMGLSMALNTTGGPEPVGGGGGPTHIHIEVGGNQIAEAILPSMISATARYGIRNSGRATGLLRPS